MENLDNPIDIKPIVRGYISSIGNIHNWVRNSLQDDRKKWENCVFESANQFNKEFGLSDENIEIDAVIYDDKNRQKGIVNIFKDFLIRRQELEKKNCYYHSNLIWHNQNYSQRYSQLCCYRKPQLKSLHLQ